MTTTASPATPAAPRRILCAIDLSDSSPIVLAHASAIGRAFGAKVKALHVFADWMPPSDGSTYPHWILELPQARAAITEELRRLVAPFGIGVHTAEGDAATEVVRHADEWHADLVVMGTHGRSGYDRLALGSVAEKVLRKAPCPVLTLPPGSAHSINDVSLQHILVPTDLSACSNEALTTAVEIASHTHGSVTVLRVVESIDGDDDLATPGTFGDLRRKQVEVEAHALHESVGPLSNGGAHIAQTVTVGRPYQEILRLARERHIDLIVMGVQGRGQVELALLGSTTNQVVRRATCPVLTVRPRENERRG